MSALKSAEAIYQELIQHPKDVTISASEAARIWEMFQHSKIEPSAVQSFKYRAFLQAALMSAIDASEAMSWIEAIFRGAYKPNATIQSVLLQLAKAALKHYYKHWTGGGPELYNVVISTIAYSHAPYFQMISQGLDI